LEKVKVVLTFGEIFFCSKNRLCRKKKKIRAAENKESI